MSWLQLRLYVNQAKLAERLSEWLQARGALAVTLCDSGDEPVFEPGPGEQPLWSSIEVQALFEANTDPLALLPEMARELGLECPPRHRLETLEDRDWERVWLDDFKPMRFGRRLWIIPSAYDEAVMGEQDVVVRLDPGLAFGTGTHPTTALCLEWLDAHLRCGQTLIDYGCGSGILAIAAAKLGAGRVWGVDIDPQALQASADNARANAVAAQIDLSLAAEFVLSGRADVVMANILAKPLQGLAASFAQWLAGGGRVVLSGILAEQAAAVSEAYRPWFVLDEPVERESWVLLAGVRR